MLKIISENISFNPVFHPSKLTKGRSNRLNATSRHCNLVINNYDKFSVIRIFSSFIVYFCSNLKIVGTQLLYFLQTTYQFLVTTNKA